MKDEGHGNKQEASMPRMPTSLLNDRFASLKLTKAYSNILIHDDARRPRT